MNPARSHLIIAAACAMPLAAQAMAQETATTKPEEDTRQLTPRVALDSCIRALTDEAKKSRSDGVLVRSRPNIADEVTQPPPLALLAERLLKPLHDDAFIDAYIRWQLTSFKPSLQAQPLNDRDFSRLLRSLPALASNPRGERTLIDAFNRTVQAGPLKSAQQEEVNAVLNRLASQSSASENLNVPALQFREWLIEQFSQSREHGENQALLRLELAASLTQAGWPSDEAKTELDAALETLGRSREFTVEQRQAFCEHAAECVSAGRLYIVSASLAEGSLAVEYATTGIFDYDARRWQKALEPQ